MREEFTSLPIVGMEPAYKPAGEKGGKNGGALYGGYGRENLLQSSKLYGLDAKTIVLPDLALLIEYGAPDEEITSYVKRYVSDGGIFQYSARMYALLSQTRGCLKKMFPLRRGFRRKRGGSPGESGICFKKTTR